MKQKTTDEIMKLLHKEFSRCKCGEGEEKLCPFCDSFAGLIMSIKKVYYKNEKLILWNSLSEERKKLKLNAEDEKSGK